MHATLLAVNGPLRKSEFAVGRGVSIGRAPENAIRLEDTAVSARHCAIAAVGNRYELKDLESESGTFVNGIPVKHRELEAGDELAIGNSLFLFSAEASRSGMSNGVELDEGAREAAQVERLRYEE